LSLGNKQKEGHIFQVQELFLLLWKNRKKEEKE